MIKHYPEVTKRSARIPRCRSGAMYFNSYIIQVNIELLEPDTLLPRTKVVRGPGLSREFMTTKLTLLTPAFGDARSSSQASLAKCTDFTTPGSSV
ncbi:hypothetical protein J6590_025581 [Homalodisca vitripennis]|nr:hypothetical protein J6590_025581 [Homalodisca vitripennis]